MAAHRYWRIRAPTTYASGYLGIAELQLRSSIGGSDLAAGKTAAAYYALGGYPASNAVDGNNSTFYTTGGTAPPAGGHWLSVDLGSGNDADIVEIVVRVRPDGFREDPQTFYVEWSDDNSTWSVGWSVPYAPTWAAGEARTYAYPGAQRHWRVRSTVAAAFGFVGCSIAELELRSSIGGSDLTTGQVAYASANYSGSQAEAQLGIDNNAATCWAANGSTPTGGHWLAVPLASWTFVEEVVITARNDGYVGATPDNLFVEYSDDFGGSWTTYWSVASIAAWTGGQTRTFSNSAAAARRRQMTVCN